jgi:hypothetical protein
MPELPGSSRKDDYKLERYKYILQQLNVLNENVHKYLSLYQTLVTAIGGGCIAIFVSWKNLQIDAATAKVGIRGLLGMFMLLTIYILFSIIAGIVSWIDYRREEVELLDQEVEKGYRKPPKEANFWRWSETYLLLFLLITMIIVCLFVEYRLLPLLK